MKQIVKNIFCIISSFTVGGIMITNFIYYIKTYSIDGFSNSEKTNLLFLGYFALCALIVIMFGFYYSVECFYYIRNRKRPSKYNTINKILERQNMEVKHKQRIENSDGNMYTEDLSFCPNCNRVILYKNSQGIHYGNKVEKCPNCSTKLKWED